MVESLSALQTLRSKIAENDRLSAQNRAYTAFAVDEAEGWSFAFGRRLTCIRQA